MSKTADSQKLNTEQKEYLREIAIPFSVKVGDINSLAKYTDDIMNVCIDASRYKEAMMHYRKYKKAGKRNIYCSNGKCYMLLQK